MDSEDLGDLVDECSRLLGESLDILTDIELDLESSKEDIVCPNMTKSDLADMAHEVADNARIKKAEASFARRHFDKGPA